MIRKCESLINAEDVLNRLMSNYETKEIDCFVDCYQNGREQGFILYGFVTNSRKAIYFCNGRRTDAITIYVGNYSLQSISEDAYRNYFPSKDNQEAVDYVISQMKILNKEI